MALNIDKELGNPGADLKAVAYRLSLNLTPWRVIHISTGFNRKEGSLETEEGIKKQILR